MIVILTKNTKGAKKCVMKRGINFEPYKNFAENNKSVLRSLKRFMSGLHNVFTEKLNVLSANDHKKLQLLD